MYNDFLSNVLIVYLPFSGFPSQAEFFLKKKWNWRNLWKKYEKTGEKNQVTVFIAQIFLIRKSV